MLPTVRRRSVAADLAALREIVAKEGVEALVIGLPLDREGEVGYQARRVRVFSDAARSLGLPVELADERFTTAEAARRGATDLDAGAAAVLLEDFFSELSQAHDAGPARSQTRAATRARLPQQRSSRGPLAFLLIVVVVLAAPSPRPAAGGRRARRVRPRPRHAAPAGLRPQRLSRAAWPGTSTWRRPERRHAILRDRSRRERRGDRARLEDDGIIRSAFAFEFVLYENDKENAFRPARTRCRPR
jgi:putative transcription antitermination factor YqgF